MKNLEKYINSFSGKESLDCAIRAVRENSVNCDGVSNGCKKCRAENLKWLNEEYVEPILTESEKAYLSSVIAPFRNKVRYIKKLHDDDWAEEYICIFIEESFNAILPRFDENTMYKDMELGKEYTLEELGL